MKKLKIGQKVLLVWYDAFGRGGWNDNHDVEKGLKEYIKAEIVGDIIKEDKNFYVLAMGVQDDPTAKPFLHLEFIPKGCVIDIKRLR